MYCSSKNMKKNRLLDSSNPERKIKSDITFVELWRVITSDAAKEIAVITPPNMIFSRFDFEKFCYICKAIYEHLNIEWPFKNTLSFNNMLRIYRKDYQPITLVAVHEKPYVDETHMYIYVNIQSVLISEHKNLKNQRLLNKKKENNDLKISEKKANFEKLEDPCDIPSELFDINITKDLDFKEVCDIIDGMYKGELPDKSTTIIRSNMGTGKTISSNIFIGDKKFEDLPIIIVIPRKKLGLKQLAELIKLGFFYYEHIEGRTIDLEIYKRIIIQLDSLHKLRGRIGDKSFKYIVYIDEIESVRGHLSNSIHLKDKTEHAGILRDIIRFSTHCIVMDANLSLGTFDFITDHCNRTDYFAYNNSTIREFRQLYLLGGPADMTKRICQDLKDGKKIIVPTNSLTVGEEMIKEIREYILNENLNIKVQLFDSNNDELPDDPSLDPVNVFLKYECCIITPAWQYGNSLTKQHFDRIYAYASACSSDPNEFSQLMHRARIITSKECFLYVDTKVIGKGKLLNLNYNNVREYLKDLGSKSLLDSSHPYILLGGDIINLKFGGIYFDYSNLATYLNSVNEFYHNKNYRNYETQLLAILKYMGYELVDDLTDISFEACQEEREFGKNKRITQQIKKFDEIIPLITATTLSDDQMNDIKIRRDHIKNNQKIETVVEDIEMVNDINEKGEEIIKEVPVKRIILTDPLPITDEETANYAKTKLLDGVKLLPELETIPQKLMEVKNSKFIRKKMNIMIPMFQDFNYISRLKTKRSNLLNERILKFGEYMAIVVNSEIYTEKFKYLAEELQCHSINGTRNSRTSLLIEEEYDEIYDRLIRYQKIYDNKKSDVIAIDKRIDDLENQIEKCSVNEAENKSKIDEQTCVGYIMSKLFSSPIDPANIKNYKCKFDQEQKEIGKLMMTITILRLLGF